MLQGTISGAPTATKYSGRRRLAIIVCAAAALWTPFVAIACMAA